MGAHDTESRGDWGMFACAITGRTVVDGVLLETNFIYDENRPFEVRLQSVTGVDLVFDRDLMSTAVSNPNRACGEGWVRCLNVADDFIVNLLFQSDDGSSNPILYPLAEVKTFVGRMFDLVPFGTESMDIDALLDDFYNDKI